MAASSTGIRSLALAAIVVVASVSVLAVVPTPAAATSDATIAASPSSAGAASTHRATATVGSCEAGDSLNELRVDYAVGANPANVTGVDASDVQAVGLDTDGDGTIDTSVADDLSSVSPANGGHTLNLGFGGSYSLTEGDTVVVEFADVVNPEAGGTYDVNVSVNVQSDPVCPSTASLTIDETAAAATVSADPSTAGSTATHTVERTVGSANQGATLQAFTVEYAATNASGLTADDVTTAGIDTDGDGTVDTDLRSDLAVNASGTTVSFSFDGSHALDAGDVLILAYDGVTNPSAGEYTVSTDLHGTTADATLSVEASTDPAASVTVDPSTVNTTAVHRATIRVDSNDVGDSLNKLRVDYTAGSAPADVSGVDASDVRAVGIDTDGDGSIDTNVSDDLSSVSASNDGHTLDLGFGGSYSLSEGDTVVVEYGGVRNPATSGTFDVAVSVNYQSDPVTRLLDSVSYTTEETEPTDDTDPTGGQTDTEETTQRGLETLPAASVETTPSTAAIPNATHVVRATVATKAEGATLQSVTVDYTAGSDPADVGAFDRSDLEAVGLDTDGDGTVDQSLADAVGSIAASNQGETVTIGFEGAPAVADGEALVVRYGAVQNPAAVGDFDVRVTVRGSDRAVETVTQLAVDAWTTNASETRPETTVAVSDAGETTTAVVQNAYGGRTVEMTLDAESSTDGAANVEATVDAVKLQFASRTNATFVVDSNLEEPVSIVGPELGTFAVRHGASNISTVNLTFDVPRGILASANVTPENVVLARRTDGSAGWTTLETTLVDASNSTYEFEARAEGLTTFAVTARPVTSDSKPVFVVGETETAVDPRESSKRVRVSATVRNVGTENGTFEAAFTSNGRVLATKSVAVEAGGTTTVIFERTFSEPAVYDVGVSGTDAGAVEIESTQPTTPPGEDPPPAPGVPPVLLALLAAVGVAGVGSWIVTTR